MKKILITILLLSLTGCIRHETGTIGAGDISDNLKLKVDKSKIIENNIIHDNNGNEIVEYSYITNKEVPKSSITIKQNGENKIIYEELSLRTEKSQRFIIDKTSTSTKVEGHFYPKQVFYNDNNRWFYIDVATTSINEFEKQTKIGLINKILSFFGKKALATNYGVSGTDCSVGYDNGSWSTCRSASTGNTTRAKSDDYYVQVGYSTNIHSYFIKRTLITFGTDIPVGSTVTAGSVNIYITSKTDDINDTYSYVAVVDATNGGSCSTSDYSKSGNTKGSENYDITSISTSAYLSMTLNATGLGFITLGGTTDLAIKEGHDVENQDPGTSWRISQITIRSSRAGSNAPYLSVTYTEPSVAPPSQASDLIIFEE